ncbi:hypothetical protein [Rickettsiales endosymbiont of Trichoplax sp. H2]|nr:hypothetical protein [Rickettsiales endosymbiont of Trichoplax sp. H2]MSO13213.1 hypothetical protein [Rickettsiales endosymbiont of Trichoplax sp. H2]
MPDGDFQDFKKRYYKIINDIAAEAVSQGRVELNQDSDKLELDFISDEFERKLTNLKKQFTDPGVQAEIQNEDFKFEFNKLLEKNENSKIFEYFYQIEKGNNITVDIKELEIPDINKDEIQAQGFVKAFEKMKEKGNDPEFQKYYKNVQKLSEERTLLIVESPEISANLARADGIFENFNIAAKSYKEENSNRIALGGDAIPVPSNKEMLDKAEEAFNFQQGLRIKLAQHIALNNIQVFDANNYEISDNFDNLTVGNIFENVQIPQGLRRYLNINKKFEDLINEQSEISKLNKVFKALDINGQNIGSFRKLVDDEKAKIEDQRQRESENRQSSTVKADVTSQSAKTTGRLNTKEQKLKILKENLAKKILKVAAVSDKQIFAIMQDPKAKSAIMKRANQVLEKLNIKDADVLKFGPDNVMSIVNDEDLKYSIQDQAEELVAQTGRRSSSSVDTRDMRGKEEFHDYYQKKAQKLSQNKFEDNLLEALKFEDEKDNRNLLESSWDKFKRIPAMLTSKLPDFQPGEKAVMGVIAALVIPPPLGVIVGLYMVGKALDEKTGALSWIADIILPRNEEREVVNNEALEKVNVKDLMTEVSQDLNKLVSRSQGQQTEKSHVEKDRVQERHTEKQTEGQIERQTEKSQLQQDVQESIAKFDKIMRSSPELQENLKVIETAKEIVGKDGVIDTGALETAQERIKHNKQSKGIGK